MCGRAWLSRDGPACGLDSVGIVNCCSTTTRRYTAKGERKNVWTWPLTWRLPAFTWRNMAEFHCSTREPRDACRHDHEERSTWVEGAGPQKSCCYQISGQRRLGHKVRGSTHSGAVGLKLREACNHGQHRNDCFHSHEQGRSCQIEWRTIPSLNTRAASEGKSDGLTAK